MVAPMKYTYRLSGDGFIYRSDGAILDPECEKGHRIETNPMYPGQLSGTWSDDHGLRRITLREADERGLLTWFPRVAVDRSKGKS